MHSSRRRRLAPPEAAAHDDRPTAQREPHSPAQPTALWGVQQARAKVRVRVRVRVRVTVTVGVRVRTMLPFFSRELEAPGLTRVRARVRVVPVHCLSSPGDRWRRGSGAGAAYGGLACD